MTPTSLAVVVLVLLIVTVVGAYLQGRQRP